MPKIIVATVAALLLSAPAALAAPSNVSVRVEGGDSTLLPRTAITTTTTPVSRNGGPGETCTGTSGVGALDTATRGDWDGRWDFGSQIVEEILGERRAFDSTPAPDYYWSFWVNYEYQNLGACETELQEGDEVLWFVDCFGACTSPKPLRLRVPATARPGESVAVTVTQHRVEFDQNYVGSTVEEPAEGATVTVDGRTATTDAQGRATVVLDDRGPNGIRADKSAYVRSATETTCVTDGADGFCGTARPGETATRGTPCATDGADGLCGTIDRRPPLARILGIQDGQRFVRGRAPRTLRGTVSADPSGLSTVKLRLTRRHGGRCWYLSPRTDGLRRTRCGRAFAFRIGDRADWSFLLPGALPRGRYVLDAIAIDRRLNRDVPARGRNRVVFTVR